MIPKSSSARPYLEAAIAGLLLIATAIFAITILDSQEAYSDDRAGLMALRESWGEVAMGYGLRGTARSGSAEFARAYTAFRARPSVKHLISADAAFAASSRRVDEALVRLELAESLGGARADNNPARYAAVLDEALGDMVGRVSAYSKSRLYSSRLSLAVLGALVFAIGAFFVLLERRMRHENVEGEESRALARALISAQEAERLRLSHELHDAVAQDLAAAKLYCGLAASCEKAEVDARRAVDLLDRSISELRDICHGLRPAELDRLGAQDACARLCQEIAAAARFEVDFRSMGFEGLDLDEELEINIYRVLQEALNNARKHASARHVTVRLVARTVSIRLTVEDDGVGPGSSPAGLGRRGMAERARMLGGGLEVLPGPHGGTLVSAWFPRPVKEDP